MAQMIMIQTPIQIHKEIQKEIQIQIGETNKLANGLLELQRCTDSRLRPQFFFSGNLTPTSTGEYIFLDKKYSNFI